MISLLN
jgi:hypothetical protein